LAYSAGGEGEVVFAPIQTGQVAVDERRGWTLEWSGGRPVLSNPGFRFVFTPHPLEAFRFLLFETRNYLDEAIRCEYDNDGRLRELIDADGRRLQFYSDVQGRIQGISASLNPGEPSVWLALYEYDRHGDLVRHTNGEGDVTEYSYSDHLMVRARYGEIQVYAAYDHQGRCVGKWRAGGFLSQRYRYDDRNRSTLEVDSDGAATLYHFNQRNLVEREVDVLGATTQRFYDDRGSLLLETDESGQTIEATVWNEAAASIVRTDELGNSASCGLGNHPGEIVITGPGGERSLHTLDERGFEVKEVDPSGAATEFSYDERGRVTRIVEPSGRVVTSKWSEDSRTLTIADEIGVATVAIFDFFGQLREEHSRGGGRYQYHYDLVGRLRRVITPMGDVIRYEYTQAGLTSETQIGSETPRRFEYNEAGLCVSYPSDAGEQLSLEADMEGRIRRLMNSRGEDWLFEFDAAGRLVSQKYFDGRVDRYEYDVFGNLARMVENGGRISAFLHSPDGRLLTASDSEGNRIAFAHDGLGRMLTAEANASVLQCKYTEAGLIAEEQQNGKAVRFTYDSQQRLTSVTVGSVRIHQYEYDQRGRLVALTDHVGLTFRFEYTDDDLRSACFYPNGMVRRYEYDLQGRLTKSVVEANGAAAFVQQFEYNDAGRIRRRRLTPGPEDEYENDGNGRLISVRRDRLEGERYTYDSAGNLVGTHDIRQIRYDSGGRAVWGDEVALEYDADGRVTKLKRTNAQFQLRYGPGGTVTEAVDNSGNRARYEYDALDRLVAITGGEGRTEFLWVNGAIAALRTENSRGTREQKIIPDPGTHGLLALYSDNDAIFAVCDQRGVVEAFFDSEGRMIREPQITAYGSLQREAASPFRLAGQFYDGFTGLHYNRYRFYMPEFGRYTTADPIGLEGGVLPYSYPLDPISGIDPLGLAWTVISCADLSSKAANPADYSRTSKNPAVQKAFDNYDQNARDTNRWSEPTDKCKGKTLHEDCINHLAKKRRNDQQWRDRRADRGMRSAPNPPGGKPPRAGRNRPDWQGTARSTNVRTYVEIDNSPYTRMRGHIARTCKNDPNGVIELYAIPKKKKKRATMDEKCGMDGEPMDFADFERDYIKPSRPNTYATRFHNQ
jgi:RHS repeat-associated protein